MAIPHVAREEQKKGLRLGTTQQLAKEHPGLSEPRIRALIHKGDKNGLSRHIYRLGRRVLIDLDGFQDWVRRLNGRAAA
jgi:hypothetical protein